MAGWAGWVGLILLLLLLLLLLRLLLVAPLSPVSRSVLASSCLSVCSLHLSGKNNPPSFFICFDMICLSSRSYSVFSFVSLAGVREEANQDVEDNERRTAHVDHGVLLQIQVLSKIP